MTHKHLHYAVCPITGLSSTISDDYLHNDLWERTHLVAANPAKLFKLIETKANSIPKSYIAAGILLQLHEEGLLAAVNTEEPYLRGKVNEMLQGIPMWHLRELYWDVRNSVAHLNLSPLTVNLTSASSTTPISLYKSLRAIAKQDVTKADMDTYIRTKCILRKGEERARITVAKMDVKSISTRLARLLPKWHNALAESKLEGKSITKAASLLTWDDRTKAPRWLSMGDKVKTRIIEILKVITVEAKEGYLVQAGAVELRSISLVTKYLSGELTLCDSLDDGWDKFEASEAKEEQAR